MYGFSEQPAETMSLRVTEKRIVSQTMDLNDKKDTKWKFVIYGLSEQPESMSLWGNEIFLSISSEVFILLLIRAI